MEMWSHLGVEIHVEVEGHVRVDRHVGMARQNSFRCVLKIKRSRKLTEIWCRKPL
jgi:hypothetical protein